MFQLRPPSEATIARCIEDASREPLPDIGTTPRADGTIPGFRIDEFETRLGAGLAAWQAAAESLRTWKHYDQPWIRVRPRPPEIAVGTTLAVAAHTYGVWSVNTCRIFDVMSDAGPVKRFGFAYRTLPRHVERGDARFWVEHREDDTVWLGIRAISRLHHPLPRLLKPLGLRVQRKAFEGAIAAIRSAVDAAAGPDKKDVAGAR
ncbi:MAG: DUF1990 domain-containing protein [Planctomyces sp.]|nr:DUF1990 domain-containing protein [Planctomyces sp.]